MVQLQVFPPWNLTSSCTVLASPMTGSGRLVAFWTSFGELGARFTYFTALAGSRVNRTAIAAAIVKNRTRILTR